MQNRCSLIDHLMETETSGSNKKCAMLRLNALTPSDRISADKKPQHQHAAGN